MIPSFIFTTLFTLLLLTSRSPAGSLDPTNAPGPTMHTLEEIYQKQVDTAQKVTAFVSPQTLSSTTTAMSAGYYAATNLTMVDVDLAAVNIRKNVTIFGVIGILSTNAGASAYYAAVPKTGQTISYVAGDDGDLEKGVVLPSPRFTDNGDGTVTDNLTGLIWLKNANFKAGSRTWATALTDCATLNSGEGGLTDASVEGDWRLPNVKELESLIDFGSYNPPLPVGHPFTGVQGGTYWSSSTRKDDTTGAWIVYLNSGNVAYTSKAGVSFVWPVRGGP
ncbi:MAG: DUF1566 domain-containing protein [bacterium]